MSVSVDNDFARFGAKSYAINKITSVEIREKTSPNAGCVVALLAFATFAFMLATIGFPPLVLFAIGFGVATYFAWKRSKRVTYQLFIITSASEQQAFESLSCNAVYGLRDQVEAAMLHHSRGMNAG